MEAKALLSKLVSLDEISKRLRQGGYDSGDSTYWGQTRKDLLALKVSLERDIRDEMEFRGQNFEELISLANEGKFCPELYKKITSG